MTRAQVLALVCAERVRQEAKWAGEHSWGKGSCASGQVDARTKLAVLAEEFGEVARALLEHDTDGLRTELVQVAAVAVAWLEYMEAADGSAPLKVAS